MGWLPHNPLTVSRSALLMVSKDKLQDKASVGEVGVPHLTQDSR